MKDESKIRSEIENEIADYVEKYSIILAEEIRNSVYRYNKPNNLSNEELLLLKRISKTLNFNDWMYTGNDRKLVCELERKKYVETKFYPASNIMGDVDSTSVYLTEKGKKIVYG